MPCRVEVLPCRDCGAKDEMGPHYDTCPKYKPASYVPNPKLRTHRDGFDIEGALCDVMTILEENKLLKQVDKKTLAWWRKHTSKENEKVRNEALAKLTKRERRVLGLE